MENKTPLAKIYSEKGLDNTLLSTQDIVQYYSETGLDYESWSKNFNMHFGYYKMGKNPLSLEGMLIQMNQEVLNQLKIEKNDVVQLLDMGCGLGATARFAAQNYPNALISGLTIVPWQIEQANELTVKNNLEKRVGYLLCDYTKTPFENNSFDGVYALESSCYAAGYAKEAFIKEAYRVLKPGKRISIADGFLKSTKKMNFVLDYSCHKVYECWALETFGEINHFTAALREVGFIDIQVKDISWNVAPSAMHIPIVAIRFFLKELFLSKKTMNKIRWNHLIACFLSPLIGASITKFGYYLISAQKSSS